MLNMKMMVAAPLVVLSLSIVLFPIFNTYPFLRNWGWTRQVADLLVINGTIYTSDSSLPFADSMAVRNGRILRIGDYSSVQALAGYGTEYINLQGRIVVPGFIDSHVHFLSGGLQMARVELRKANTKEKFVEIVKAAAKNMEHGSWILGGGWNNDFWGGELPMATWIDDITENNPVWLSRMDGHMGLANSLALEIAGVTKNIEDPIGGTVVRNTGGEPTGLLIDSAMKLVLSCIPEVSKDDRRKALERASNLALMRGVTTVVDFGRYFPGTSVELPWEDLTDVYRWADIYGKMKIRVCLFFPMRTWQRLVDLIGQTGRKLSQWIYLGGVKDFSDGSLGSSSALFYKAYAEEPHNYGLQVTNIDDLLNSTISSDKFNLQVAIHAIGDRANGMILDMYTSVVATNGMRDRRFRIEHAQHLAPGAAAKFGQHHIVASVQPDHLLDDAESAIKKLGLERAQEGSYMFKSLLNSDAVLAFGSDWPVADINPLSSIKTAMERIPPGWENGWITTERISLPEALNASTILAAKACFLDKDVGSLSTGKMADFVVLMNDSWEGFAEHGYGSIAATYVGGRQAYIRNI
ncbi:hypothetical protein DCAR_0519969 [Daucus carota subsp. sativus]|uniref:Amidohydrolase 3 domain-containing protein n=1 Tax=Daucus carota subsp. sativus TaxID=79200 RepID=A0AAF0X6B8_DAUCS|nr:PREDICTED: putative amidohydrolase YtcJ [Daucus carota subsp. sativus]WOH00601.1 hypothetical protein DCAR_0519969 [Daucus carota subsp. sativus]